MHETDLKTPPGATVAVIVVNYNAGVWLTRCVNAALASEAIAELVVVDNASTDRSLDTLAAQVTDSRCSIRRLDSNLGFGKAVNVGAASVSSPYVLLLNPDCLLRPTTIATLLSEFVNDAAIGACGPVVLDSQGREQRGSRRFEPTPMRAIARTFGQTADDGAGFDLNKTDLPRQPTDVDAVSGSCMLIRKTTFDAIGGMDERFFLHCEDLDLCRRIRDAGQRVLFVPATSVIHLQGGSGRNLRVEWYKHRSMLMYHDKHAAADTAKAANVLLRLGVWARFCAVAAPLAVLGTKRSRPEQNPEALIAPAGALTLVIDGSFCATAHSMARRLARQGEQVLLVSANSNRLEKMDQHGSEQPLRPTLPGTLSVVSQEYLRKVSGTDLGVVNAVYSVAPLAHLMDLFADLSRLGVARLVAVVPREEAPVDAGVDAQAVTQREHDAWLAAKNHKIGLSILYPTLLYGGDTLSQIDRLCGHARRLTVLPLLADGAGLRQPLHVQDLVSACQAAGTNPDSQGRSYRLGGAERLTHEQLLTRIVARATDRAVRIYRPPPRLSKWLDRLIRTLPYRRFAALRLLIPQSRDILSDNTAAQADLGFRPRPLDLP